MDATEALERGGDDAFPRRLVGHVVADERRRRRRARRRAPRPASARTSVATTLAPSAANRRTSASPCPRAPPVTIATLPSSRPTAASSFVACRDRRAHSGVTTGDALRSEPGRLATVGGGARSHAAHRPRRLRHRAARGIGRAIALALADAGADVAVADVHPEPFRGERYYRLRQRMSGPEEEVPTADAVAALGRRSTAIAVDVSDPPPSTDAVAACTDELGPPDILVNNAGIVNNIAPIAAMTPDAWAHEVGSTCPACSTPCGRRHRGWPSAAGAG